MGSRIGKNMKPTRTPAVKRAKPVVASVPYLNGEYFLTVDSVGSNSMGVLAHLRVISAFLTYLFCCASWSAFRSAFPSVVFLRFSCSACSGVRLLSNVLILRFSRFDMVHPSCFLGMTEIKRYAPPPIARAPKPTSRMVAIAGCNDEGTRLNRACSVSLPTRTM
jgi:hypothetical protein